MFLTFLNDSHAGSIFYFVHSKGDSQLVFSGYGLRNANFRLLRYPTRQEMVRFLVFSTCKRTFVIASNDSC